MRLNSGMLSTVPGLPKKWTTSQWNQRPTSNGMGGQFGMEWVDNFKRNGWSTSTGIRTLEARLDQRDRQRAYRQRLAKRSVMDQGSKSEVSAVSILSPAVSQPIAACDGGKQTQKTRVIHDSGVPYCIICGRTSRFVDPFHSQYRIRTSAIKTPPNAPHQVKVQR